MTLRRGVPSLYLQILRFDHSISCIYLRVSRMSDAQATHRIGCSGKNSIFKMDAHEAKPQEFLYDLSALWNDSPKEGLEAITMVRILYTSLGLKPAYMILNTMPS